MMIGKYCGLIEVLARHLPGRIGEVYAKLVGIADDRP
jgi:hypothetical protein